jgi:oxygen-independent coproporphyrinogen-3 oxidase
MDLEAIEKKPTTGKEKTAAGNYFVANYPPFSFWNTEDINQVNQILESEAPTDVPLGIYYHIPFCRKRCHFCYFRVYTDKNAAQIASYLDATLKELKTYAQKPYLRSRKPKFIYFGGGTPSYLSAKQLTSLTDRMKAITPWDEVEEVTFECEPGTLNEKKLEVIKNLGTTRLSLGIENFNDHILEINGRAHRSKEVFRAYDHAKSLNFPQINIDLIAGMVGETDENWKECISKTIELQPDSVTIYQMEIPFNTTIFKEMTAEGREVAPIADWKTKRDWLNYGFEQLEGVGYKVTSGYTAVRDPKKTRFVYRDELWTGADLLALGVASFGQIGGAHYQNITQFDQYLSEIESDNLPVTRAFVTSQEEKMIRELILQLKLGEVSNAYFKSKFDVDITQRFKAQLEALSEHGWLEVKDDFLFLTRDALIRVDSLLHSFFLTKHQNARYT